MISNQKRRKDIVLLATVLTSVRDGLKAKDNLPVYNVMGYLPGIDEEYVKALPIQRERHREARNVLMVVNRVLPQTWPTADPMKRMWFVTQMLKRLVTTGWRPPRELIEQQFVQALWDTAQLIEGNSEIAKPWQDALSKSPEVLRDAGYF